jgi:hypothetical protein
MCKFKINEIVYNQKNQNKGMVLQTQRIVDTIYYLVKMENSGEKIWLAEYDLDNKSLRDKLFNKSENIFACGGYVNFNKEHEIEWDNPAPSVVSDDVLENLKNVTKLKTLTGMQAVDRIIYLNETIESLQDDLSKVHRSYTKSIIKEAIEQLQAEHDKIAQQLNFVRITYKEV